MKFETFEIKITVRERIIQSVASISPEMLVIEMQRRLKQHTLDDFVLFGYF